DAASAADSETRCLGRSTVARATTRITTTIGAPPTRPSPTRSRAVPVTYTGWKRGSSIASTSWSRARAGVSSQPACTRTVGVSGILFCAGRSGTSTTRRSTSVLLQCDPDGARPARCFGPMVSVRWLRECSPGWWVGTPMGIGVQPLVGFRRCAPTLLDGPWYDQPRWYGTWMKCPKGDGTMNGMEAQMHAMATGQKVRREDFHAQVYVEWNEAEGQMMSCWSPIPSIVQQIGRA